MQVITSVITTPEERVNIIGNLLTTGFGGLAYSGIELDYSDKEYAQAKASLEAKAAAGTWKSEFGDGTICLEDVQAEMLRMGFNLTFIDHEEGDKTHLNLALIEKNWHKVRAKDLEDYIKEDWDDDTACNIIQMILWGDIVYG